MTLNQAIKYFQGVSTTCKDKKCASNHKQIAEWLIHYRELLLVEKVLKEVTKYLDKKPSNKK